MGKQTTTVIVWGKDGYNALGLLRLLHEYVDTVFLLYGRDMNCATRSKYCIKIRKTQSLEEGLQWLLATFSSEREKSFLISTGDVVAEFVDLNKEKLENLFYLTGTSESGLLTRVLDKNTMSKIAKESGFLVPWSRECSWNTDVSDVECPCILKPSKNSRTQRKPFKTRICKSPAELKSVLDQVKKDATFILQEFIPKQYDALVYGCRNTNGSLVIPGVLIKDRWDAGGDGSHGFLSPNIPSGINIEAIKAFLSSINYYGLFSVEFGLLDDKAFFYEFNLRNDGTAHYFYQAGVNIPMIWISDTLGNTNDHFNRKLTERKEFIAITDDYNNVKNGNISKKEWINNKTSATVFRYKDKNDMSPYYWHVIMNITMKVYNKIMSLKTNNNG